MPASGPILIVAQCHPTPGDRLEGAHHLEIEATTTGLLIVDPYNDFISEGGILWPMMKEVAEALNAVPNMIQLLQAARNAGIAVFFAKHHRWYDGDIDGWKTVSPAQKVTSDSHTFAAGTWGGTFREEFTPQRGDVVAKEHWGSSGFANTDLDLQLKKHQIRHVVIMGMRAGTCIESTTRFASELGYQITLVKDAIAGMSWKEMTATLEISLPNYANDIVSTEEALGAIAASAQPAH